jgi:hypothetical protein
VLVHLCLDFFIEIVVWGLIHTLLLASSKKVTFVFWPFEMEVSTSIPGLEFCY